MNFRYVSVLLMLAGLSVPAVSLSQSSSATGQIRFVVPFPPGASTDQLARLVGGKVAERLGKRSVVENKAGAGGQLGLQQVINSPADGNTLLVTPSGPISISAHLRKLPYDPASDLLSVAMIAYVPTAIAVSETSPIRSLKDLIAAAKTDRLTYGVAAIGTHMHMVGELLKRTTGTNLEVVAYRGVAPTVTAVVSGEVAFGVADVFTLLPLAKGGRARILAVTGAQRTSTAPELPTVAELGVSGYSADAWIGIFAPSGTPGAVVERLNSEVAQVLSQADVKAALAASGLEPFTMPVANLRRFLEEDSRKWKEVIREANIKLPD